MKEQVNNLYRYWKHRHWRAMHRSAHAHHGQVADAIEDVPKALQEYWVGHGPREFPGMPTSEKAWAWSVRSLLTYFAIATSSNKQTVLPSRAADSVWHAWLAWDAASLCRFQVKHFQKEMPHVETKNMRPGRESESALPRTWALASKYEGQPVLSGSIPFIFMVDRVLDMPQGWHYQHNKTTKQIELADIGNDALYNSRLAPGLTAVSFLALGLVAADEAQAWQKAQTASASSSSSSGGSGCGIGMPGFSCGSSSDGGGDSGSSCGGGCGGD